jgi:hypothetical protein
MANTQFIKQVIEPYIRGWLAEQFPGQTFQERDVPVPGGFFRFDGANADLSIVAQFTCSRSQTRSGNENFGGSRKLQNDVQSLKLAMSPVRLLVFTNPRFRELVAKRAHRLGLDSIQFLQCDLPVDLQTRLDEVLDAASKEQRSRIDDVIDASWLPPAKGTDLPLPPPSSAKPSRGSVRTTRLPAVRGSPDVDSALIGFPERITAGAPYDQRVGYKSWKVPRRGKPLNWMQWNDGHPPTRIAFPNSRGDARTWKLFARFPDDFQPRGPWDRPEPYDRAKDQYMPAGSDVWGCSYEALREYLPRLQELEAVLKEDLAISYRYAIQRYGERGA